MAEETNNQPIAEPVEEAVTEPETTSAEEAAAEEAVEEVVETINDNDLIKPGMVIRVHMKIKETTPKGEERERIQIFQGTVLAKKGQDKTSSTITVRKVTGGIGVERIFPLRLPTIAKIEVVKQLKTRRSKIYFARTAKKKLREVKQPKASKK